MRTIHRSCHRCPFPKPPPLLQATAVTPPGRKPIFPIPWVPGGVPMGAGCGNLQDIRQQARPVTSDAYVPGSTPEFQLDGVRVEWGIGGPGGGGGLDPPPPSHTHTHNPLP